MQLSQLITIGGLLASGAIAHSWLECVDTHVEGQGKEYYKEHPEEMNDGFEKCTGYPRNIRARRGGEKDAVQPESWVDESSLYSYEFQDHEGSGGEDDILACRKCQETPTTDGPPAATVTPGQELLMRYWGNGHSYWDPTYSNPQRSDPGVIRIYWAGEKEKELKYKKDLTIANWIPGAQANFSSDAIIQRDPSKVVYNQKGQEQRWMKEWANYFTFKVPEEIENGRHMMVWGWAWKVSNSHDENKPLEQCEAEKFDEDFELRFGTCFDIYVENSSHQGPSEVQKQHREKYKDYKKDNTDVCNLPCKRIGGADGALCDPAKEDCGACRMIDGDGNRQCYATCTPEFLSWGALDCSKKAKRDEIPAIKPRHSHRHKHRRRNF